MSRGVLRALALVLALVACLCPSTVAIAAESSPRAERPTYSLGEKWIRNDGVYELIRIVGDRYIFSAGSGREIHLSKDLGVANVHVTATMGTSFDPPLPLSWPLEVGKWGTGTLSWDSRPFRVTWSIDSREDVRSPAGTFKAFRITHEITSTSWPLPYSLKAWYAPEVQQFVKMEGSGSLRDLTFQVVAIDRPLSAPLQVALLEPKDQARLSTARVVLTGKAKAGKGVARVTVTLNGQEVARQGEPSSAKTEVSLNVPLTLQEGKNTLLVTAVDSEGATHQAARTVFYERPAPTPVVSQPTPAPSPAPTTAPPVAAPLPSTAPAPLVDRPAPAPPVAAATLPFQMALASPPDQARVEHETVAVAGVASGGKGIRQVVVTLNGVEVKRLDEPSAKPAVPVNLPLTLREGSNTLVVTAVEADGRIHQEIRTVHFERREPLTVAIRYPEEKAHLTDATTILAAVVTSSKGVAKVTVTLNGTEAHQQSERTPPKSLVVTAPVTFQEGANILVVSASEPDGTTRQDVRTVFFVKPTVPVAAQPPPRPAPNRWAVIVGVGRYESLGIPRLRYAVPDAEAIYQVLTGPAGFKPEHVLLLTDTTERKPTLRNLKWALGTFLARSAQKDDTVVLFFAGHGAPETDPRGIERDGLAKYIIPSDADPDDLYATALPMDELQTIFGRIEAERVVVFLDTCYSGAAGGRTFAAKKTRALTVDDLFLERLTRSKGRAIITASRPSEVSIELPELGHGLFTYYLLQGLQGGADRNRDGIVSLQELYEYVEQQVRNRARATGGNQHPVMKGELEGILPLVKVAEPRK